MIHGYSTSGKTMSRFSLFLGVLLFSSLLSSESYAQVFSQDFNSSTTVSTYVNATTPSTGQFNAITAGSGSSVSASSNNLAFTRGSGACSFSRSTSFSPVSSAIVYKFDLRVSGTPSTNATTPATWRVGTGFGTGNSDENDNNTFARMSIDFRGTSNFRFNDVSNNATSSNYSVGTTYTITWVLNNSGSTRTYISPSGTSESVANNRIDFWVGTTRVWNDVNGEDTGDPLEDLKFYYGSSTGTITMDNINIQELVGVGTQPSNQSVCADPGTVSFTAASSPSGAAVQWQVSTNGGSSWSNISGATSATYSFTAVTGDNGNQYRAIFNGLVATNAATLTVNANPSAPTATPSGNTICGGQGAGVALSISPAISGTTYSWPAPTLSGVTGGTSASSQTSLNQILTNNNTVAGTAVYTISATTPAGCTSASTTVVTITVNPSPVATATPSSQAFCGSSATTNIDLTSSLPGTSYTWAVSQAGGVTGSSACASGCGTNISQTLSNAGGTSGTATYTVTPTDGTCTGSTITVVVTLTPTPVGNASNLTPAVCSGTGAGVTLTSSVTGTTYAWAVSQSGVSGATPCASSCGTSINQTLTNGGTSNGTATYTVTPTANGCPGAPYDVVVTVKPIPAAIIAPSTESFCGSGTTGFALSSPVSGATFSWTASQSNATGASASSGATIAQLLTLNSGSPTGSVTYTVTPTANGCNGSTATATVSLLAAPSAVSASPSSTTICPGASVALAASGGLGSGSFVSGTGSSTSTALSNTSTLGPNPLQNYYGGSKQQMLWRASELTALGLTAGMQITSISINLGAANTSLALNSFRVKVQHTALTALTTSPVSTGWTTVYGPTNYTPNTGQNVFTFSSPFTWNGTSNLLVEMNFSNNSSPTTGTNAATFNTGIGFTATTLYRVDNQTPATLDGYTGTMTYSYTSRNNVTFGVNLPGTFTWSPAAGLNQTTGASVNASPSTSTTYTVTSTLGNGCTATASAAVNLDPAISGTFSSTDVLCFGQSTGSATVTPSGGDGSYTAYLWSNGQTTATATGLAAGTYSVTITDGLGCTGSASVTINQPVSAVAISVVEDAPILCNGGTTTVTVTASGGVGPYTGEGTFTVGAGTHNYTVADANGCQASTSITVSEPAALVASCVATDISCFGLTDGQVVVSSVGGTGSVSGTGTFGGLSAGTYNYTVTDANGCTSSCSATIAEPALLVASCSATDALCFGGNGSVAVSAVGGTTPYSGDGTFAVPAGTYNYTVTDARGCTSSCSATVGEPTQLVASCSATDAVCFGGNGSVDVTAVGGTGAIAGTGTFSVVAGTYNYTVTDANGCTASCSATVGEPAELVLTCTVLNHVSCNGGNDGSFSVSATGGTGPYSGTGTYAGAVAGTNPITVTDANGCTANCTVVITEPAVLVASCTASDALCLGGNGSVTVSAVGGTTPYSGVGTFAVSAGTYNYTVTDVNGCTSSCSATVSEPTQLVASCSATDALCFGGNGSVAVSAVGGTTPYSGDGTFAVPAGTYNYTVTDARGCTSSCSATVGEPTQLVASCSATDAVCFGGNGSVDVTAVGGTGAIAGTGTFSVVAGTYNYTVTDANGCTASCSATVGEPAELVLTCTVLNHVSCNGGNDGSFSVSATGGTGPYSGTGTYAGAVAGTNPITVTDANGCTANCTVVITEPAVLVASCTASDALCLGGNGSVTVAAVGGTTPYSGDGTFAVPAGTYNYTVTDANGCTASCSATVNDGPAPTYNSTTVSACISYTWSVNSQSYTASGSYTAQVGPCAFEVLDLTVTPQPPAPTGLACYETASFNTTTCSWDITGTQPVMPTLACYETASFNTSTCQWDVTGTQPAMPTLACYETASFNTTTCQWDVTGTQPAMPTLACYETASFNTTTCQWDVTGTQPAAPTGLACYETASFNGTTCQWDVTGTQPAMPTLACYETASFNTTTCQWDVTGTQPAMPTLACYETASFNGTTCQWDVTGTQPA
ncbi:MAG: beta strand repeat-containing protein, partial [Bacteroidota bacterium]